MREEKQQAKGAEKEQPVLLEYGYPGNQVEKLSRRRQWLVVSNVAEKSSKLRTESQLLVSALCMPWA